MRDDLTPAELRELRYAAEGLTGPQAASQSVRALETIKMHRARVIRKLGAANMVNAVHIAHKEGIL